MSSWDFIQKHVLVGSSGTGKSSLLVQLTDSRFLEDSDATIGVEYGSRLVELASGKTIKLQIWDTAGQETFRSITRSYYRGAEGALLVFDVTHRPSFVACNSWLKDLRTWADENLVITLIGNKVDLVGESEGDGDADGSSRMRQVSSQEAKEWAESEGMEYVETSAKTGINVEEAFNNTARRIHSISQRPNPNSKGTLSLGSTTHYYTSGCC